MLGNQDETLFQQASSAGLAAPVACGCLRLQPTPGETSVQQPRQLPRHQSDRRKSRWGRTIRTLAELEEERYRRKPTILTSNLDFPEWQTFLGNKALVDVLLSRLRHQCHTIHIDGPSLRDPQG